jgi:membrane protein implicated in regulation of membrane protease activity
MRNKCLKYSAASAILAFLLLIFFPGQALLTDGRCIRFINVPFVAPYIEVPGWYQTAFVWVFLGLMLLTVALLMLAWKYRKRIDSDGGQTVDFT